MMIPIDMGMVWVFLIWIASCVICARKAAQYGRNPLTWALGGLIFGPFALFLLFLMGRLEQAA